MRIVVPGEPVPKARPRMTKTGHVYTPKTTKDYEEAVALMAMASKEKFGKSNVCLTVDFHSAKKRSADVDNYVKSVADGLMKAGVFDDDSQIFELHARKFHSEKPHTVIYVTTTLLG